MHPPGTNINSHFINAPVLEEMGWRKADAERYHQILKDLIWSIERQSSRVFYLADLLDGHIDLEIRNQTDSL